MFLPEFEGFAARYEAGEPSLVSLRLVADLETPVSAFMKLSHGRSGDVFLLESVEGGSARGRYSMIGLDPDVIFRVRERQGRDQPRRAPRPRGLRRGGRQAARRLARPARRIGHSGHSRPAPDGRRHLRLSRLRHGARDGAAGPAQARSDRHSGRLAGASDPDGRVRFGARRDLARDPGPPAGPCRRQGGLRERRRAAGRDRRDSGRPDAPRGPRRRRAAAAEPPAGLEHQRVSGS